MQLLANQPISSNKITKLAKNIFKSVISYNNHTVSFRNQSSRKSVELLKYIWDLAEKNNVYDWLESSFVGPVICLQHKKNVIFAYQKS